MTEKYSTPAQQVLNGDELLSLPVYELLTRLGTSASGLSSQEAEKRIEVYGRNEFSRGHKHSALASFFYTSRVHWL